MSERKWGYDGEDSVASQDWDGDGYEIFIRDEDGEIIEAVGSVIEEDHAKLIVRAVNSHDDLVEALKRLEAAFEERMGDCLPCDWTASEKAAHDTARAALRRATGEGE